jgi:hypothetical protein
MNTRSKRYIAAAIVIVMLTISFGAFQAFKAILTGVNGMIHSIVQVSNMRVPHRAKSG